ncbi:hypothetical protein [Nocardioides sp. URHA0032]|uniref:hypothetical protein n=1 Tax=Nocardioides sp. URHA0032 TaxID=1380388 RepID=UPI00048E93CD|nr:hypothetical protein [Nocardioides sp. URHA0032]
MWVDLRHEVDETASRTAHDPGTAAPSPTATPTVAATVHSLWIGDGYTAQSCGAARRLGWECTLDAEHGTGFLSDGVAFDPDNETLADRLPGLPHQEPDVVVVDATDRSSTRTARSSSTPPSPTRSGPSTSPYRWRNRGSP